MKQIINLLTGLLSDRILNKRILTSFYCYIFTLFFKLTKFCFTILASGYQFPNLLASVANQNVQNKMCTSTDPHQIKCYTFVRFPRKSWVSFNRIVSILSGDVLSTVLHYCRSLPTCVHQWKGYVEHAIPINQWKMSLFKLIQCFRFYMFQ